MRLSLLFSLLLLSSTARAQEIGYTMEGFLLGPDDSQLEIEPIYRRHFSLGQPRYLRTLAWQVGLLTIGTSWYWIEAKANARDWDYPSFIDRFTSKGVRFDNNSFTINHLSHPLSGGFYYLAARGNDLGVGTSSLVSFVTSAVWEFGLEFREKVSINDQIFTPGAGIAMGEVFYRLGHYLNSAPGGGNWAHKTFAWLLGFPVAVHRWLDDVEPVNDGMRDSLGLSAAYHHRFRLTWRSAFEQDAFRDSGLLHGFQLELDLIAIPGFQKPGTFSLLFDDGNFTHFDGAFAFTQGGDAAHVDLWFESALFGQYEQDFTGVEDEISGMASRLSVTFSFEHVQRWVPSPRDRRAVLHLPGANAAAWLAYEGLVGHIELALHPDFVAIDSLAFPLWKGAHPELLAQSVAEDHGYYFGFGGSAWLAASLAYSGAVVDGRVRFGHINSIEGLDRAKEKIQHEVELEDDILEYRLRLRLSHPTWLASAGAEYQSITRLGSAGRSDAERSWNRYALTAGFQF